MQLCHRSYITLLLLMTKLESLGFNLFYFVLCCATVLLYLIYYAQCYAHERICALFCTKLTWLLYHKSDGFIKYVTGPAKTGHICTKYTCSENSTFLGLCLWYSCSVNFLCFLIDLWIRDKDFIVIEFVLKKIL